MNFVNPWFFAGLLAASVPVLLHLVKRERAQKYEFPSLMYLRMISRKTIRYQKLRHLLLLMLRILAFVLLALAFTRPFRPMAQVAAASGRTTHAHVIAVDNSLSMGYGDRWARAREAATRIARGAQPDDKLVLLEFSDRTTARTEITNEPGAILDQLGRLELTDRPTRYGQALRSAERFALDAGAGRRTIYLISDFQKSGNAADEQDFRLGSGIELERVDLGSADFSNLAIGDVRLIQGDDATAQSGDAVKFSVVNYGNEDRNNTRVTISVDGRTVDEKRLDVPKGAVRGDEFKLPATAPGQHPVILEVEDPRLARDNRFSIIVETRGKTPVLSVESPGSGRTGRAPSFFLEHALNVLQLSPYRLSAIAPQKFDPAGGGAGLVVWNVAPGGDAASARKLQELVRNGGGAVVVIPDPAQGADFNRMFSPWLPVRAGAAVEPGRARRPGDDYSLLTDVKLDHPIFKPFSEPHSGTFSTARFYRHARLETNPPAEVLARFDNGDPALVLVPHEKGRVLIFPSSADDRANDLPLKPAFAPFWQQMLRYLENFREGRNWMEVGETISPRNLLAEAVLRQGRGNLDANQAIAIVDPANARLPGVEPQAVQVDRVGFYSVKTATMSTSVAVNPVPRESDLTHADSEQWTAGWTAAGTQQATTAPDEPLTPEEQDRTRRVWRYLLAAALLFLLAEGLLANSYVLKTE